MTLLCSNNSSNLINLDFGEHNTLYATHGLHAFAAKCPPQLAKFGIENYSDPGDIVLDPMAGSGTTLVEARLLGRNVLGFDIDPLSCLIARVKSRVLDDEQIDIMSKRLTSQIQLSIDHADASAESERYIPQGFPNLGYWFDPEVVKKLAIIVMHISETAMDEKVREFFWVAFSSLILSKVSIANARDIIHSRHHFYQHNQPIDVLERFNRRIQTMRRRIAEYRDCLSHVPETHVLMQQGDARALPVNSNSIDLVFTSPPYATALDYTRAHFLAVGWMQRALGITLNDYKTKGAHYIGSERGTIDAELTREEKLADFPAANSIVARLAEVDTRRANLLKRYFVDMVHVLSEMSRVLKPSGYAIIVVCPSHIRKIEVPTHQIFTEVGSSLGLKLAQEYTRTINARRRVLPYVRESFGERMSTEYVLIYQKLDTVG